jgi:hypothetical protein
MDQRCVITAMCAIVAQILATAPIRCHFVVIISNQLKNVGAYYEWRDNAGDDGEGESGSYRHP